MATTLLECDNCGEALQTDNLDPDDLTVECRRCFARIPVVSAKTSSSIHEPTNHPAPPLQPQSSGPLGETGPAPQRCCQDHPSSPASFRCTQCQSFRCDACTRQKKLRGQFSVLCLCGGMCVPIVSAEKKAPKETFGEFLGAFSYPLRSSPRGLLIIGGLFFGVADLLNSAAQFALVSATGTMISLLFTGYAACAVIKFISTTVNDPEADWDWPTFDSIWSEVLSPILLIGTTSMACFGPALVAQFKFDADLFVRGTLLTAGCLVFPMCLASVAVTRSLAGLHPGTVLHLIWNAGGSYALACALLAISLAPALAGDRLGLWIPIVGPLLGSCVSLYALMVQARILGLTYRRGDR